VQRTRTPFLVHHLWILDWLESIKTQTVKDRLGEPERGGVNESR
jgi:hypothetical protein